MDKRDERYNIKEKKYSMSDFIDYCKKQGWEVGEFQVDMNTPYIRNLHKEVREFIKKLENAQRAAANSKLVFKVLA